MKVFKVTGGVPLRGEVDISGSKNAALPIIFATLVARGVSRIECVPKIGDTEVALDILRALGAKVEREGNALIIDTENVSYCEIEPFLVGAIRASTYLLGSCLGRFSRCSIYNFGGCKFSDRPIDMHLKALEAFGGIRDGDTVKAEVFHPADITFRAVSVGATINALILASAADGVSTIKCYAKEPHVIALCDFLSSAGAEIRFGEDKITVRGGRLHGGRARIIPDMIEAGTYLSAGLVTNGDVTVKNVNPEHLTAFIDALVKMGASVTMGADFIRAARGENSSFAEIFAAEYPGFPTDLHPIIVPVLASFAGGRVTDNVWRGRYGYLESLKSFGLNYILDDGVALISNSNLHPANATSTDLRGGMAALISALGAVGDSSIMQAEYILRGYEHPAEKLRALGAKISLCDER